MTKMSKQPEPSEIYPYYDEFWSTEGFKGFLHKFLPIPLHTFYPLRQELYLFLIRVFGFWVRWSYKQRRNLLINIGSGDQGKPGWINIDMIKSSRVNCLYDCRKSLPFSDSTVRGIFCEHFVEHLDYTEEIPFFLSECYRVLQAGGVLRIIIPNAEEYLLAYASGGWDQLSVLRKLNKEKLDPDYNFTYRTRMELINMVFRQAYRHRYAYDFETMNFLLSKYGFSEITRQEFGKTRMPELNIDNPKRAIESLYIEAIKPI